MKTESFKLVEKKTGEYHLFINTPEEKVNILSQNVFKEFDEVIKELKTHTSASILFIRSVKQDSFIAGANVAEIQGIRNLPEAERLSRKGKDIYGKLAGLPFPSVAVINGTCLGGGLELALACTYRIATDDPKTSMGLPEVQLGILPGLGGTQRLPRLVGLRNALSMILTGAKINPKKAKRIHLVDRLYHKEYLEAGIEKFKELALNKKGQLLKQRKQKGALNFLLERNPLGRMFVYRRAKASILAKSGKHYPAPLLALRSIRNGFGKSLESGMNIETTLFARLAVSEVSKNLIRLFYTSQQLKKQTLGAKEKIWGKISKPAVLGAGVMGGMIAWLFNYKRMPVVLKDINWDAIAKGFKACRRVYNYHIKKRRLKLSEVEMRMLLLSGQTDYRGFKLHDLVIEAIPEDLQLKLAAFKQLEQNVVQDTIIASNTSSLSINRMAAGLKHPERFIGMHFFNPVNRMPLVEIIPGSKTAPEVVTKAVRLMHQLGKTPVVVKDCPGFLVNRILLPYLNEALHLMVDGVGPVRIDSIMRHFGMPMGPVELLDEIGLDTAYKVLNIFQESYGTRMNTSGLIERIMQTGTIKGKKNGMGFYKYSGNKQKGINKQIEKIIIDVQHGRQISIEPLTDTEVEERMLLGMINEAFRCLEEGIVESEEVLDFAMINGTGFPPFTGGPICYAHSLGLGKVHQKLKEYATRFGHHFFPCSAITGYKKQRPGIKHSLGEKTEKKPGTLLHS